MDRCAICLKNDGELERFTLAIDGQRCVWLHFSCAEAFGFWCKEHRKRHTGLFDGLHYCPQCYLEAWERLQPKAGDYFVRLITAKLPPEQYLLLSQSLRFSPLATSQRPFAERIFGRLFLRALERASGTEVIEAEIEAIIDEIISGRTFVGHLVPEGFAQMAEGMGPLMEWFLAPPERCGACDHSQN